MRNFINKAAWQDALLKEEILEEVSPGAELPTGEFDKLMGFDSEGSPVAVELGPEHWTDSGSGIPVAGTNLAAYFPESGPELPPMRFLSISQIGESLIISPTGAQARSAIGAGTSNFDGTWGSLSNKPTVFPSEWSQLSSIPAALTAAQAAGTASIRAIGTTATTAAAGNHSHNGSQIALTGYAAGTAGDVLPADTVNQAIAKLEARIAALEQTPV